MCYMCIEEKKCNIDCGNNVGGKCLYMKLAEETECNTEECKCHNEG